LQRVLTTEFIHGTKISDVESLNEQGFSLADIDRKLFRAFSEQIFHRGFVHADPHPGNGKKTHHCVEAITLSRKLSKCICNTVKG
jgi:predicted unusual protein kinase regulating ubiquinone biosynthesis (AarF/ABC1/UbiB family)